jgi:hypothetical protein
MDARNAQEKTIPTVPIVSANKVYCEYPYTKGKVHQCHIVRGECEYCEYSSVHKCMTSSEYCAHLANSVRPNTFI